MNLTTGVVSGGHARGDRVGSFEVVLGSAHGDRITGDPSSNELNGGAGHDALSGGEGDDRLIGGRGNDTLRGGDGHDLLTGGAGNDRIVGGQGEDRLRGGAGGDTLAGGEGWDTLDYAGSNAGVTVNLATGIGSGGHAQGDRVSGFEVVVGSAHGDHITGRGDNDELFGSGGNDTLNGRGGEDTLSGGAGADRLNGGPGWDILDYRGSNAGVTVNLATGIGSGGHAQGDRVSGFEKVIGSAYGDRITGGNADDELFGGGGADTLQGGRGNDLINGGAGADRLDGGEDWDALDYGDSNAGVTVNLATGRASGGHARGDRISGFEGILGSEHDDRLIGDNGDNTLYGRSGADFLDGGAGWDYVAYWGSGEGITINLATGEASGGEAQGDTIAGFEGVDGSHHDDRITGDRGDNDLHGNGGDDTLRGGGGNDALVGGPGADRLSGGAGRDTVEYYWSDSAVTVNLATGTASGGDAEGDRIAGVENVVGSMHDDRLTGDRAANELFGNRGDDTLAGGGGADVFGFRPDDGDDTIVDFTNGVDRMDLEEFYLSRGFEDVSARAVSGGVRIDLSAHGGGTILLENFALADLDASDFLF